MQLDGTHLDTADLPKVVWVLDRIQAHGDEEAEVAFLLSI